MNRGRRRGRYTQIVVLRGREQSVKRDGKQWQMLIIAVHEEALEKLDEVNLKTRSNVLG